MSTPVSTNMHRLPRCPKCRPAAPTHSRRDQAPQEPQSRPPGAGSVRSGAKDPCAGRPPPSTPVRRRSLAPACAAGSLPARPSRRRAVVIRARAAAGRARTRAGHLLRTVRGGGWQPGVSPDRGPNIRALWPTDQHLEAFREGLRPGAPGPRPALSRACAARASAAATTSQRVGSPACRGETEARFANHTCR